MRRTSLLITLSLLGCGGAATSSQPVATQASVAPTPAPEGDSIARALEGAHRSAENRARDAYRHPEETLRFFGVAPTQHVVELWPGRGWYSEVLAPLLREQGKLTAVVPTHYMPAYKAFLAKEPQLYDRIEVVEVTPPQIIALGAPGSADVVLTFRNVHNWQEDGFAQQVFKAAYDVLKPGGVLGIEDHRANPDATPEQLKESGYIPEQTVIELATQAGFVLEEKSELNANPKDTKDYEKGVWTLPPTLALGEQDRDKYRQIGESDRMTLRFRKPAAP